MFSKQNKFKWSLLLVCLMPTTAWGSDIKHINKVVLEYTHDTARELITSCINANEKAQQKREKIRPQDKEVNPTACQNFHEQEALDLHYLKNQVGCIDTSREIIDFFGKIKKLKELKKILERDVSVYRQDLLVLDQYLLVTKNLNHAPLQVRKYVIQKFFDYWYLNNKIFSKPLFYTFLREHEREKEEEEEVIIWPPKPKASEQKICRYKMASLKLSVSYIFQQFLANGFGKGNTKELCNLILRYVGPIAQSVFHYSEHVRSDCSRNDEMDSNQITLGLDNFTKYIIQRMEEEVKTRDPRRPNKINCTLSI
ncbi:MAG: hypothetical protein ACPGC9_01410 [Cytophagales bacterium]